MPKTRAKTTAPNASETTTKPKPVSSRNKAAAGVIPTEPPLAASQPAPPENADAVKDVPSAPSSPLSEFDVTPTPARIGTRSANAIWHPGAAANKYTQKCRSPAE